MSRKNASPEDADTPEQDQDRQRAIIWGQMSRIRPKVPADRVRVLNDR